MGLLLRYFLAAAVTWLLLAGTCLGKQVYLRDGAILECESFWRRGEQVMVKVNRDIILEFDQAEIDSKKTFPVSKKKTQMKPKVITARQAVAKPAIETVSAVNAAATAATAPTSPVASTGGKNVPAQPPAITAAKQKQPPAPATAAQAEQPQPAPVDPASPHGKAEQERKMKEASEMMAEAIKKQDPELLKKAVEAQKNAVLPEQKAQSAGVSTRILLIMVVFLLLMLVSMWVVYEKAGQPGWHSIIPIYNMYVMMEISGKPWWWMLLLFVPVVGFIIYLLAMISLAQRFGRGLVYGLGLFFLPMFFFPMLAFGGAQYEG